MFKYRSQEKELLDGQVDHKNLVLNLKELRSINTLLGGYNISIDALNKINTQNKTIVDIGSGGGDTLEEIRKWSQKKDQNVLLFGVDLKLDCVEYAKSHLPKELIFIHDDYRNIHKHLDNVDILHACLFTHHLTDQQIVDLIRYAKKIGSILIVNDLERNPLAHYSIKWLTRFFSKSQLVKNDAPLSVLRGFKKKEWFELLRQAGAKDFSVKWKWAFRHQIIVHG